MDYRKNNPDKKWIVGSGWEQDLLGRFPSSEDIDEVCPDVPVLLLRTCYHVGVVNQKALDIAGVYFCSIKLKFTLNIIRVIFCKFIFLAEHYGIIINGYQLLHWLYSDYYLCSNLQDSMKQQK